MFAPDTMLQEATQLTAGVATFCAGFDVDSILSPEVKRVHQQLVRAKKFLEGSLVLLARRVEESGGVDGRWGPVGGGVPGPGGWYLDGDGQEQIRTSKQLGDLPETEQAVKNGDLSAEQAAVITDAASVNLDAEGVVVGLGEGGAARSAAGAVPAGQGRRRCGSGGHQARIHAGRRAAALDRRRGCLQPVSCGPRPRPEPRSTLPWPR